MKTLGFVVVCGCLAFAVGCGGMGTGGMLSVSVANTSPQVFQGQASVAVNVSVTRTGSTGNVTLSVSGLPSGASDTVQSPGAGNSGSVTFTAATSAAPGTYPVVVSASDGTVSGDEDLNVTIGAAVVISNDKTGPFSVAMSTSFQPAEWDYQFFTSNPQASTITNLNNLGPNHIRLQGISQGIPQGMENSASTAWDFSVLDGITQPVLGVGDHSPEFQIAKAPPFMYVGNDSSNAFVDPTFQDGQFAGYAKNLVEYYNNGGFMANGNTYVSPAWPAHKITYWGIYNEPSINNQLDAAEYTAMYNALVPAMKAVDGSIKFVGLELCCSSEDWALTFASNVDVDAPVDVVATHYYSSCNQKDTDAMLLSTVPGFATSAQTIHTNLATNPALANVPIWVTENNVNADYDAGNGMSACNPGQVFVDDLRGSSPFFAGWRPYVFSALGKAGVQALYHWDYDADPQFGEVNFNNGDLQLSYWVDYELGQIFPPTAGSRLLQYTSTDDGELETLPVINSDDSVVVMVANHTVNAPSDNNGPGSARSVLLDVSALGAFSTATLLTIDKNTDVAAGPVPAGLAVEPQIPITLNGYSVVFLILKP